MSTWSLAEQTQGKENSIGMLKDSLLEEDVSKSALLAESFPGNHFLPYFASTRMLFRPELDESHWLEPYAALTRTLLLSDAHDQFVGEVNAAYEPPEEDVFAKENSDRITLLARKFALKERFSDEESARLKIATERVRQLIPAVTADEVESLAAKLDRVMKLAEEGNAIRAKLGIAKHKRG